MKRLLSSIIDVRKGEGLVTVLMTFYIYTILLVYYLLKPARDSLFLSNAGPALLPLVFVLIAVVVVPITTFYSRVSRSLKLSQLINITTVIIILNLFILRWMLTFAGQMWVFFVFYIWVSIYGALITSQFWLLANAVYDAAQAKRIFVIFSLAAIIGAFSGGAVTSIIVSTFGVSTEDLLYVSVGFLLLCIPLVNLVWGRSGSGAESVPERPVHGKAPETDSFGQMFTDIKGSRHLRLIMGIIAITMATASFVDYQFKFVSTDAYSDYAYGPGSVDKLTQYAVTPETVAGLRAAGKLSDSTLSALADIAAVSARGDGNTMESLQTALGLGDPRRTPVRGTRAYTGVLRAAGIPADPELDARLAAAAVDRSDPLTGRVLDKMAPLMGSNFGEREAMRAAMRPLLTAEEYEAFNDEIVDSATRTNKEAFTSFLGLFYGGLSLLGFLFQFLFSYRALKLFGVGGVILMLPFSQVIASVAMLVAPNLVAAVLLRGSDGVFKYSIDKTARELLFLPIPLAVKKRSKVFIDLFIDRVFRGIAGLVLLYFTLELQLTIRQLSVVVLGMVIFWIVLDLLIRKEYVNAFRQALDRGEIDPDQLTFKITDASTVTHLMGALKSDNHRQVAYALSMLTEVQSERLADAVYPFLSHDNAAVRGGALRVLRNQAALKASDEVERLLRDPDADVRIEAMEYRMRQRSGDRRTLIEGYLSGPDEAHRSAVLGWLARYGDAAERALLDRERIESIRSREGAEAAQSRRMLARVLGADGVPAHREALTALRHDSDAAVVRDAIAAMGRSGDREYIPELLHLLGDRRFRRDAREALAAFGNRILGTLNDHLNDPTVPLTVRKSVPRVMRTIPTQESVDLLTAGLDGGDPTLHNARIEALHRLRTRHPELRFDAAAIRAAITREARFFYKASLLRQLLAADNNRPGDAREALLLRALAEKCDKTREHIFRLLALIYPPRDIGNAYQGIVSANRTLRASGLEFVENLLAGPDKRIIIPLLDKTAPDDVRSNARRHFDLTITDRAGGIRTLFDERDPWLQACALYAMTDRDAALRSLLDSAAASEHPLLQETARLLLERDNADGHGQN